METITQHQRNERKDQLKSATITALITALLFLLIFYYQFVREIPKEEKVTTMLINFGDNRNGNGAEEPVNQEGSLASSEIYIPEELKTPEPTSEKAVETPKAVEKPAEKLVTGKSEKATIAKSDKKEKVADACIVTSHFPKTHGAPIHVGYPNMIGIDDISKPDYGDAIEIKPDEIPLFWPCGVTPQNVITSMKLPFAITHAPGHMFVTDRKDSEYYE